MVETVAYISTIPGIIICGLALVAYAGVASQPKARSYLDRVSFRLLIQTLVCNLALSLAPLRPSVGCEFGAFAANLGLSLATFFTTFIAVNLQMVLVHGFNGKILEKYYIVITVVLGLVLNVPAYASGELGWNVESGSCWYSNPNRTTRLQWIIATQSFWMSLAAVIESVSSFLVIYWLYSYKKTITVLSEEADQEQKGTRQYDTPRYSSTLALLSRDPKYRRIILRIALYPIVSLTLNFITVALDLRLSIVGSDSPLGYRLLVLDVFLLGIRTLVYGLLAFGDPSFISAIRELRGSTKIPPHATLTEIDFTTLKTTTTRHSALMLVEFREEPGAEAAKSPPTESEKQDMQTFDKQL
ncbi:hypothetical protein DXG01_017013 [Tephrocybe rancida]|nr:hypothetical protein DXG01_017013 [Tephrocybe rancida]